MSDVDRTVTPEQTPTRLDWYRLVVWAPVGIGVTFLAVMVIFVREFEPFLFVIGVIPLIAAYVGRRFPRRAGPITVLVVLALLVLLSVYSHCANIHLEFVGRLRECKTCHDSGYPGSRFRPRYLVPRRMRLGLGAIFSLCFRHGLS